MMQKQDLARKQILRALEANLRFAIELYVYSFTQVAEEESDYHHFSLDS